MIATRAPRAVSASLWCAAGAAVVVGLVALFPAIGITNAADSVPVIAAVGALLLASVGPSVRRRFRSAYVGYDSLAFAAAGILLAVSFFAFVDTGYRYSGLIAISAGVSAIGMGFVSGRQPAGAGLTATRLLTVRLVAAWYLVVLLGAVMFIVFGVTSFLVLMMGFSVLVAASAARLVRNQR